MDTIVDKKFSLTEQIERIAKDSSDKTKRYDRRERYFRDEETIFLPIRHFNSDTPITPGLFKCVPYNIAEKPLNINYGGDVSLKPLLVGGGYFLWHKGEGIAIDPGYGFVDSLHCYHGLTVSDIDTIIITHDHMDHHADLETIFNLKRGVQKGTLKIFTNKEVIEAYSLDERPLVVSNNMEVFDIWKVPDLFEPKITKNVSAIFLPSLHWQRVRKSYDDKNPLQLIDMHLGAFGIQLILNDYKKTRILITGDTIFPIEIEKNTYYAYGKTTNKIPYFDSEKVFQLGYPFNKAINNQVDIINRINKRCNDIIEAYKKLELSDIVCLHIGSIRDELKITSHFNVNNLEQSINQFDFCYKGFHLGLTGMLRLMNLLIKEKKFDYSEGLIIITEFGEELLGNRQNICAIFAELLTKLSILKAKKISSGELAIIPSEVILKLKWSIEDDSHKRGIICSYCQMLHDWKEVSGIEGPGEIISYAATGPKNNIHPNCTNWG